LFSFFGVFGTSHSSDLHLGHIFTIGERGGHWWPQRWQVSVVIWTLAATIGAQHNLP
jgi:hypothetical protein